MDVGGWLGKGPGMYIRRCVLWAQLVLSVFNNLSVIAFPTFPPPVVIFGIKVWGSPN